MATARSAAEAAGRDPDALECIVGAPSKVSDDIAQARDEVRWFPAMVSNHVMDLIEKYGWDSDIPSELTDFVKTGDTVTIAYHDMGNMKHAATINVLTAPPK